MNIESCYRQLLKYRTHIMGIAILWVAVFHTQIYYGQKIVDFIKEVGYCGVDIFFFVSGIGLYYSLKKNSVEEFYLRRMKRIMPAYIPIVIVTFLFYNQDKFQSISLMEMMRMLKQVTGNIFMVGWLNEVEGQFNWYVQAIIWFYLIAPVLYSLLKKIAGSYWKLVLFFITLCLFELPFFYSHLLMATSRIFIFVLGMLFAIIVEEKVEIKIPMPVVYLLMVIGVVAFRYIYTRYPDTLRNYGTFWFPFIIVIPGFCIVLAWLLHVISKIKWSDFCLNGLKIIGSASFEIYLVHIVLYDFILHPLGIEGNVQWWLAVVGAVVLGCCYKKLIDRFVKIIQGWRK